MKWAVDWIMNSDRSRLTGFDTTRALYLLYACYDMDVSHALRLPCQLLSKSHIRRGQHLLKQADLHAPSTQLMCLSAGLGRGCSWSYAHNQTWLATAWPFTCSLAGESMR